jgi:phenylacetate-CoA ligase
MFSGASARIMRKLLLAYAKRMDRVRMLQRSRQLASRAVVYAARHSKAYRCLLQEHGLDPKAIGSNVDFSRLPILTKVNTFQRFGLDDLARPVATSELADVLTSSGRSGRSFGYRLSARQQHEAAWFNIDLGLQDAFDVDTRSTLLINCLPMGVVFRSRAVTIANVSVREDMACSILRDLGRRFDQTLLCTDPLFIRRLLDEGRDAGIDWQALNTSVIMGEEVLVESQRGYIASRMGIDLDNDAQRMIASSFGVGELGLNLLFETRETIRMCRSMRTNRLHYGACQSDTAPSIFCFNPLRCHIEVLNPGDDGFGELCFTMLERNSLIPLPRYASGDLGRLASHDEIKSMAVFASTPTPWLPVIFLRGRISDRPSDMPSVECIKELVYSETALADQLTGAFQLSRCERGTINLALQAASNAAANSTDLHDHLIRLAQLWGLMPMTMQLVPPASFPCRPVLDYERKFGYMKTA